jgi:hypothetical protein
MYLQRNKMATMRGTFYKGSHFGEMCLLSPISLQISTAIADVNSEVYSLSKSELWKIFLRIPRTEQRIFLIKLFTEVNGVQHSIFREEMLHSLVGRLIDRSVTSTVDNLYELADGVLNEIIDEGIRRGSVHHTVKETEDVFYRHLTKDADDSKAATCPWYEVLRVYEQMKLDMILAKSSSPASSAPVAGAVVPPSPVHRTKPAAAAAAAVDDDDSLSVMEMRRKQRRSFEKRSEGGSTVSGDLRKRITSLFQFMDLDGTGGVSREEVMSSLQSLGWKSVTWDFVDHLMAQAQPDSSDRLHVEDLVEVIVSAMERNELSGEWE